MIQNSIDFYVNAIITTIVYLSKGTDTHVHSRQTVIYTKYITLIQFATKNSIQWINVILFTSYFSLDGGKKIRRCQNKQCQYIKCCLYFIVFKHL